MRSSITTSVFTSGSVAKRRLNAAITAQLARITGDYDIDNDACGKINGMIMFAQACGMFGATSTEILLNVRKFRKTVNDLIASQFKNSSRCPTIDEE